MSFKIDIIKQILIKIKLKYVFWKYLKVTLIIILLTSRGSLTAINNYIIFLSNPPERSVQYPKIISAILSNVTYEKVPTIYSK